MSGPLPRTTGSPLGREVGSPVDGRAADAFRDIGAEKLSSSPSVLDVGQVDPLADAAGVGPLASDPPCWTSFAPRLSSTGTTTCCGSSGRAAIRPIQPS